MMTAHDEAVAAFKNEMRKAFNSGFTAMRRGYDADQASTAFENWWAVRGEPKPPLEPKPRAIRISGRVEKASRGPLRSASEWWEYWRFKPRVRQDRVEPKRYGWDNANLRR